MFLETPTGNRISDEAVINGSNQVMIIGGSTICAGVELNGTAPGSSSSATIEIGKCSFLSEGVQVLPPKKGCFMGSYVVLDTETVVRSASIGSRVLVGANSHLGENSVVHECCVIRPGTVIPPKMIIAPYSMVSGIPEKGSFLVEPLPSSYKRLIETEAKKRQLLG